MLNIYYSKTFNDKERLEQFFINNFLFKNTYSYKGKIKKDYLSGIFFNLFFYDINTFSISHESIDIIIIDDSLIVNIEDNIKNNLVCKFKNYKNIFFVALTDNFGEFDIANKINFIRVKDINNFEDELLTSLYYNILRVYTNKTNNTKLTIFLSHSKIDGENIAIKFKNFIDNDTKINNFFDVVDIQDSVNWEQILEENIYESIFLFIYSDSYSNKIWTQRELILAKQKNIPIVGVDILSNEDSRVSPFISNIPLMKFKAKINEIEIDSNNTFFARSEFNYRSIINSLLKEALKQKLFISMMKNQNDGYKIIGYKPDFYITALHNKIIYPEPPIIKDEEEIYKKLNSDLEIVTPLTKNIKSLNKKIALSISESQNLDEKGLVIEHLHLFMNEIARYLLIRNCILVYGGDIFYKRENFNFIYTLEELHRAYNKNFEDNKKFINYSTYPFASKIDTATKAKYKSTIDFRTKYEEKATFNDFEKIAKNLTRMRKKINKEMDIKIALGGKINGYSGFYPGIYEEVYLALKSNKPVFLIGGFGGVVEKIIDLINGKEVEELTFNYQKNHNLKLEIFLKDHPHYVNNIEIKYKKMYDFLKGKKYKILNNGLEKKENKILFQSKNIFDIIKNIMKGLESDA